MPRLRAMNDKILIIIVTIFALSTQLAHAKSSSLSSLVDTVRNADLIFVGQVQKTPYDSGNGNGTFSISIENVLKKSDNLKPGPIQFKPKPQDSTSGDYKYPVTGTYGLFFLKRAQGSLDFIDADHPVLEIEHFSKSPNTHPADPLLQIVNQLTQFLAAPEIFNTSHHKFCGYYDSYSHAYFEAANALKKAPYELVRDDLHAIANSKTISALQSLVAIDCMFSRGDYRDQDKVQALILTPLDANSGEADGEVRNIHGNWCPSVSEGAYLHRLPAIRTWILSKPELVRAFGEALRSPKVGVRRQAACALSEIGTHAVEAPLSQSVNDKDHTVQYFAGSAPSKANGVGFMTNGNYQYNENTFMDFWRSWMSYVDH